LIEEDDMNKQITSSNEWSKGSKSSLKLWYRRAL